MLWDLSLIFDECIGPKLTRAERSGLGVAAKVFTIVGTVIVYGVSASVVYGSVDRLTALF